MGNALGFKPTFVAYRGSAPAITDLLAGQIDLLWDQVTNALPQIQGGMLHGIAITSTERLEELKDAPTTAEPGMPDITYTMWHGLYVAKGTPNEADRRAQCGAAQGGFRPRRCREAETTRKLLPFPARDMSPEAHGRLFAAEMPEWRSRRKLRHQSRRSKIARRPFQAVGRWAVASNRVHDLAD